MIESVVGLTVFFLLTCILGARLSARSADRTDRYDYVADRTISSPGINRGL